MTVLTPSLAGRMMPVVPAPRDPAWKATSLGPVVSMYLADLADRKLSQHTISGREGVLARMCKRLDGYTLPDLSGKAGRQVLKDVLIRDEWAGLQANSLDTYISVLKAFFDWAYDEELVLHDPARRLDRPEKMERRYNLFTPEEQATLFRAQPFTRDRVGLMLHFEFAMRATDLRLLQLGDIDLARQSVRLKNGKGGTDRTLSFRTRSTFEAVNAYLTLDRIGHPDEFLLYPMQPVPRGRYTHKLETVTEDKRGEPFREPLGDGRFIEYVERKHDDPRQAGRFLPFGPSGLRHWWGRCLERADVPHRRMHDARHTTGTRLAGKSKDLWTVSKFLRHSNLNTTDLYVHLNKLERMRDELWEDE